MRIQIAILTTILLLCLSVSAQQGGAILQGAFTASAGAAVYRGKWSAQVSTRRPNAAAGSWILLNERNDIILQGTWSAQKSGAGWKGTWRARVQRGRVYSGSWTASEPGPGSKTLAEMLQAATKNGAADRWSSGSYGGDWRLAPNP